MLAANNGHDEVMRALITHGADINTTAGPEVSSGAKLAICCDTLAAQCVLTRVIHVVAGGWFSS